MQFLSIISDGLRLDELNRRLHEWIDKQYHITVHSSTKETPLQRYLKHLHLIREAPNNLHNYFRTRIIRKVDKDRTVSLLSRTYEAPVELIGKTVTLFCHEQDPSRVEVFYNSKSYGMLIPLNVNVNCKVRRKQHITELISKEQKDSPLESENHYKGGILFEKGNDEDDEL